MKNNLLISLIVVSAFIGLTMALIPMYIPDDGELSNPLKGSYIYLVFAIFILVLSLMIKNINSIKQWFIVIPNIFYGAFGMLLFLICIYAPPMNDGTIEPLGGSLFFLSGMLVFSGILIMKKFK